jgi:hypothetical protein
MNKYYLESEYRSIVIQRKKYVNSDNNSFTIDFHYDGVKLVIECNEEPEIYLLECASGENLTKLLDNKYPNYQYYFGESCDGVISRDVPEDVKRYINNLPDKFHTTFLDDCRYDMLDSVLEEYGWEYNKKDDELWVYDYTPKITHCVYPNEKELAELDMSRTMETHIE